MTGRPSRDDIAGAAYLDLRRAARANGRLTDEYLRLYVLEGWMSRLAASPHTDQLVIKGGVLMAAYAIRRPTADVDVAARNLPGQVDHIRNLITGIASRPADDGIIFDLSNVQAEEIRDEDTYAGIRVSLTARLATAIIRFHVDINIGDPIWPEPRQMQLPRLLGGEITLRGYPLSMVLAEKIVTAVERGTANTRWRDFADIYLLSGAHAVSAAEARQAINNVADHRHVTLRSLRQTHDGYAAIGQARWAAWRRRQMLESLLPARFSDTLDRVWTFADPLLATAKTTETWDPEASRWL